MEHHQLNPGKLIVMKATFTNNIFRLGMRLFVLCFLLATLGQSTNAQSNLCASSATTFCCEYVSAVSINGVVQNTANTGFNSGPGYQDFSSSTITNLVAGNTYPVSVTVKANSTYHEYVKVWFDFNGNGNLQDAGELVMDQNHTFVGTHVYTGNVTIPTNAFNGPIYIRVIMVFSAVPQLCGNYTYGNTLDFKANISGGLVSRKLSVNTTGAAGSIVSSPAGINTGSGINSANFPDGSTVTLSASNSATGVFKSWSGGASGNTASVGVVMNADKSVTANYVSAPTLSTSSVSGITQIAATSGGTITADGGDPVTARGVCWNTGGTPTISNNKTTDGSGTGAFTSSLTGLAANTTYYVRSYATNSAGTAYGNQVSFTTPAYVAAGALSFDGNGDYAKIPDNANLDFGTGDFTVEAWVKKNVLTSGWSNNSIIGKWNHGGFPGTNEWLLSTSTTSDNNLPNFIIEGTNGVAYQCPGTTSMALNTWYHIAAVREGGAMKIYVNGNLENTISIPANLAINNVGRDMTLGAIAFQNGGPIYTNGAVDEIRIWKRGLCQYEIQNNMNCELAAGQTQLTAYYSFNHGFVNADNSGITTLADISGNGQNGTLWNMALTGANSNWIAGKANGTCALFTQPTASISANATTTFCAGGSVTLSAATNISGGTYQWFRDGSAINGATGSTYQAGQTGNYSVVVSKTGSCSATSNTIAVTVSANTIINTQPASQTLCSGAVVSFAVSASGTTLTYQWRKDGIAIPGATSTSYSINSISTGNAGNYDVVVNGACGQVTSAAAVLTVNSAPIITCPLNQTASAGANCKAVVTYVVSATGTPNPAYTYTFAGATTGSGSGTGAGAIFNKGVTTVTVTAANLCNTQSCNFTVTVNDDTDPVPTVESLPTITGECSASAMAPTATDNCSGIITATATDPTSFTAQGTYIIHWVYTDASGNTTSQEQTVIVKDVTPPVVTCPTPIVVNSESNKCGATVNFIIPKATDNCTGGAFNNFNGGEPNNYGSGEDYLQLYNSGTWNDLPNGSSNRSIVEFNTIKSTVIANYTKIGDFGGHSYYISTSYQSWTAARSAAQSIGGDLASINTQGETNFLSSYGGNTWVGGYQDHSDPSYIEPGNAAQNFGGWKWVDGTKLGAGQIVIKQTAGLAPGSFYPVGETTNTFTATDEAGNTSTCSFTVTVKDVQKPVITTNGNKNITAEAGICGASVTVNATAADNCSVGAPSGVRSDNKPLNAVYPVGTTTIITWNVKDVAGNDAVAVTQTVTVTDNEKPTISAPADIEKVINAGVCYASGVVLGSPVVNDNCSVVSVSNNAPATFPKGTTTVTWTVKDGSGNTATATQIVTVVDNQNPSITAPADINTSVSNGCSVTGVILGTPVTADNCGAVSVTNDAPASYNVGTTIVTWTVKDMAGNVATATQKVIVADDIDPVIAGMPSNMVVNSVSNNCLQLVTWTLPTASDNCGIQSLVPNDASYNSGSALFPVGLTTINYTATDIHGNIATASFTIMVLDKQAPTITGCPADITQSAATGKCGKKVTWNPPTASDNCSGVTFDVNHLPGEIYPVGTTVVTYTAKDASGNINVCSFNIVITDDEAPVITSCPSAVSTTTNSGCTATGVSLGVPTGTDNCGGVTFTNNAPAAFPIGNTIITWTATDTHGNTAICTQVVTVIDNVKPVITSCPAAKTVFTNEGCSATGVALGTPTGTDNCGAVSFTNNAPAVFPLGNTTVTWTATDAAGNITTCTQVVTVSDNVKPTITCPVTQTLNLGSSCAAALPDYRSLATVSDNCSSGSALFITQSPAIGSGVSGVGVTAITLTVTDAAGNSQSCTFNVERTDVTPPVITCVAPITVSNDANSCGAVVTYATPTATDNCIGASGSQTFTYTGSITEWTVPAGVTSVTMTAKGAQGGNSTVATGGRGASMAGTFSVTPGQTFKILVGQQGLGTNTGSFIGGGGGGGSFVVDKSTQAPYLIAGAGGGAAGPCCGTIHNGIGGVISTSGTNGINASGGAGFGGSNGNGGTRGTAGQQSGSGGGLLTKGGDGDQGATGGLSFIAGGTGGATVGGNIGGFGGGGGTHYGAGGGGGGYSGGGSTGGGGQWGGGGGGGSFNAGTNQLNQASTHTGNGQVIISWSGSSATVVQTSGLPSGAQFPIGTTTNTFVATDASGNTSTCSFNVTVNDTQAPVITCPSNINKIATSAAGAVVTYNTPVGTDNCTGAITTRIAGLASGATFPIGTTTVTYQVKDAAGLTASCSFNVTVVGVPPVVVCPANITVNNTKDQCGANVSFTATETTAIPASTITYSHEPGSFFPVGTTKVTVTATNPVGKSTCTFTVTVVDAQAPVLVNVPVNKTVECNAVPQPAVVTATDNCYFSGIVNYTELRANGNCPSNYTLTRTWSATDAAGNTTTASQVITVQDTEAPVLTVPSNISVNNDGGICGATVNYAATATDNCNDPVISYSHPSGTVFPVGKTTVTVTAEDACGNKTTKTFTVSVSDNEKPVVLTNSFTIQLDAAGQAFITKEQVDNGSTDNCGVASVSIDKTSFDCSNVGANTVTLTITDVNGNSDTKTATVTVEDKVAPVISCPDAVTLNCQDNTTPYSTGSATATDACGIVSITFADVSTQNTDVNNAAHYNYTINRTWTATDKNGNSTSCVQVITVQDITPPVVTCPASVIRNCQDATTVAANGSATATDNCAPVSIMSSDVSTQVADVNSAGHYNYVITRTWKATDVSGNTTSCVQTITVKDDTAPVITTATNSLDRTEECSDAYAIAAALALMPAATDNCAPVTIHLVSDVTTAACGTTYTRVRQWNFTDPSGNTSTTYTQTLTVLDRTAPVLSVAPADVTVNCEGVPAAAVLTATDNCDQAPAVVYAQVSTQTASGIGHYNYTLTRTWTATDACGNASSKTQVVTVQDITAPVLVGVPADVTAECSAVPAPAKPTATDNCDASPVITLQEVSTQSTDANSASHYNYTITRTWTVKDVTGNNSSATQVVTVRDITAPVITCPASITLNCQDNSSVAANGSATATDNCSPVAITSSDVSTQVASINSAGHYNYTITRTWVAKDVSGNSSSCVQVITVQDITAPVIACPADKTLNCQDATTVAANGTATATDNCAPVSITSTDVSTQHADVTNAGHYNYIIKRTWKATDVSGNNSVCVQTITVRDITAPVVVCPQAAFSTYCYVDNQQYTVPAITATDNCSPLTYSYTITGATTRSDNGQNASGAFNPGTSTITWTVKDVSGNTTTCTTVIVVNPKLNATLNNFTVLPQGVNANTLYLGYTPASAATITVTATGGTAPYTYSWSKTGSAATYTVVAGDPSSIRVTAAGDGIVTFTVVVTDSKGCAKSFSKTITVTDIRCGTKNDKVLVCHNTGSAKNPWVQVCISDNAVATHLANGGYLGTCNLATVTRQEGTVKPAAEVKTATVLAYPNPSRGNVNLRLTNFAPGNVAVQVRDGNGKLVATQNAAIAYTTEDISLNLNNVAAGIYHIRIAGSGEALTTKVVIAR
jgi:hypothetical protein